MEGEGKKLQSLLAGSKTAAPKDAYAVLEKTPLETLANLLGKTSNAPIRNKIRNYIQKWRPMRSELPAAAAEMESIGMPRGPKFDKLLEDYFAMQMSGKVKTPEDRTRVLRKLSGIKEPPPKKIKETKKKAGDTPAPAPPAEAKGWHMPPLQRLAHPQNQRQRAEPPSPRAAPRLNPGRNGRQKKPRAAEACGEIPQSSGTAGSKCRRSGLK